MALLQTCTQGGKRLRAGLHVVLLALSLAGLGACADRPSESMLRPVVTAGVGSLVQVLVATSRERSTTDSYGFTDKRAQALNYEQHDISIPPNHVSGQIEWPDHAPGNPARNMVVASSRALDRADFARLFKGRGDGDVVVFVHGYNTNYQEAVFRVAQLARDTGFPGTTVAFAWPSRGTVSGYVADRESTTYSRDYLEQFLNDLAATPGVKRIHLVAHSMGNWLAVETLRQAKLRAHSAFLPKLGEVMLMAPDIDVEVFRTQLDIIGRLNQPITVLVSADDRALAASQRLAGDVPRVGNVDPENPRAEAAIRKYDLRVIDLSKLESDDRLRHSKFVTFLPKLREVTKQDEAAKRGNPVSRTGLFVADTAGNILQAPLRLGQAVLGQ